MIEKISRSWSQFLNNNIIFIVILEYKILIDTIPFFFFFFI